MSGTEPILRPDRLKAFTDGVIAIIITIMVLELRPPEGSGLADLGTRLPVFLGYLLSFVYVGIYWNNHHHFFEASERIDGAVMWANLHLLFWLSLIPFATAWAGEHPRATGPAALYGAVLLACALAFNLLQWSIIRVDGRGSVLARAVGGDWKGKLSPVLYLVGIGLAFIAPVFADLVYAGVALLWLVPDRRVSAALGNRA